MSFFSRSRSRGHYPNNNHGSNYYKKSHNQGGLLGKILRLLMGSRGHSRSYSHRSGGHNSGQYNGHNSGHDSGHNRGHNQGHQYGRHHRKSSWS